MRRDWSGVRIAVVSATFLVFAILCVWTWPFTMDDAFISFRYAKHIGDGIGPVWNLADAAHPIEGYTSFLYVWILGGIRRLTGADVVLAGKSIGVTAGLLLTACIAWAVVRDRLSGLAAATALSVMMLPFTALNSVSGMETALFILWNWLCAMACVRVLDAPGTRATWQFVCLGLLGTLTRPEFAAAFLVMSVYVWWQRPVVRPALVRAFSVAYVLPGALVTVWRYSYYGSLVPYSFFAKQTSGLSGAGWLYVAVFLGILALPYLIIASSGWRSLWDHSRNLVAVVSINVIVACGYFSTTKPLMGWWFRFLLPQVPLLAYLAAVTIDDARGPSRGLVRLSRAVAACLLIGVSLAYVPVIGRFVVFNKAVEERYREAGRRMGPFAAQDRWLLFYNVGSLVYESEWNTQDEVSLNTDRKWRRPPCDTKRDLVLRGGEPGDDVRNPCPGLYEPLVDLPFLTDGSVVMSFMRVYRRNDIGYADQLRASLLDQWPPLRRQLSDWDWVMAYRRVFDRVLPPRP